MRYLALFLLLFASPALAQTLELKAGDSTLLDAAGGSVVLYLPNQQIDAGLGVLDGHLVASASDQFKWRGFNATAGDSQVFLTTGQAGLAEVLRGFSLAKKTDTKSLVVYAGLSGNVYSAPFTSGTTARTPAAGIQFAVTWKHGLEFATVESISGHQRTALQEVDWLWRGIKLDAVGGTLQSRHFATGSANGQWKHFGASLSHSDYLWLDKRATVNSQGVALAFGPVFANASAFQSNLSTGQAASVGIRVRAVTVQGQEFFTKYGRTNLETITEQVSRHLRLSQYVSFANGQKSFNGGFAYTSNRGDVSVGYNEIYQPFGVHPFAKALTVQVNLHLRGTTVSGGTLTDPNGKTRFTAYGDSWVQTGVQVQHATEGRRVGGYSVRGRVLDAQGQPVAGAALVVGTQAVWTDEQGVFQVTERKPEPLPVRVVLDDFVCAGTYEVVDAPTSISPTDQVTITVRRTR